MRLDAGATSSRVASFYDMLETRPGRPPARLRLHEHLLLAARRRRALAALAGRRPATTRTFNVRASSASAPATSRRWPRSTASTSARSTSAEVADARSQQIRDGDEPLPDKQTRARRASVGPEPAGEATLDDRASILFKDIDEPGLATLDVYERRGGYDGAAQGARDAARGRWSRSSRPPACAAAAAPASTMGKKASFLPKGDDGQVPRVQRRRVRAGHLQGPRADAEEPAPARSRA